MTRVHPLARLAALSGVLASVAAGCAHAAAQDSSPRQATRADGEHAPDEATPTDDTGLTPPPDPAAPSAPLPIPAGRLIATLDPDRCAAILATHEVRYERLRPEQAPGVAQPIRLSGPVGGVAVEPRSASPVHAILDCRLAVALLAWAPTLRAASIDRIQHYSVFRPAARIQSNGRPSGHATGLAIDSALYRVRGTTDRTAASTADRTADGTTGRTATATAAHEDRVLDVLSAWAERERGGPPCPVRDAEPEHSRILRSVVCAAVRADLFQVVLTPHADTAHQNHLHLEVVPDVDWSYVH